MHNRLSTLACGPLILLAVGGFTHGKAPLTFEGKAWNEALEKVPCGDITKDGIIGRAESAAHLTMSHIATNEI